MLAVMGRTYLVYRSRWIVRFQPFVCATSSLFDSTLWRALSPDFHRIRDGFIVLGSSTVLVLWRAKEMALKAITEGVYDNEAKSFLHWLPIAPNGNCNENVHYENGTCTMRTYVEMGARNCCAQVHTMLSIYNCVEVRARDHRGEALEKLPKCHGLARNDHERAKRMPENAVKMSHERAALLRVGIRKT